VDSKKRTESAANCVEQVDSKKRTESAANCVEQVDSKKRTESAFDPETLGGTDVIKPKNKSSVAATGSAASCVTQTGSKKRKKSSREPFSKKPVWTKMSDSTVAGMNVLAHIWRSIQLMLETAGVVVPDSSCIGSSSAFHIHVRPFINLPSSAKSRTGCNGDCDMEIDDTATCEPGAVRCKTWCEDVVAFVEKFHVRKRKKVLNAMDPPSVDRSLDTAPVVVASEELPVHFEAKVDESTIGCENTPEEAASSFVASEAVSSVVVAEAEPPGAESAVADQLLLVAPSTETTSRFAPALSIESEVDPVMVGTASKAAVSCAVHDVISSQYLPLLKTISGTVDTLGPSQSHRLDRNQDDCLCNTPTLIGLNTDVPSDTDDQSPSGYSKGTTDWQDAGNVVHAGCNSVQEDWCVGSPSTDIYVVEESSAPIPWITTFASRPHYRTFNDAHLFLMR
jgi:hypothetical protein